jgi:hypothetical protein
MYGNIPDTGIKIRVPNPPKAAFVRLPTNEEMLARLDAQKSIRRDLGRRKSQTEYVPNPAADLALFNKIRLDKDGPEFDEYEAADAIGKLTYAEVTSCDRSGEEYVVTLKTSFGDTVHTVKSPTRRDIAIYRRTVVAATDLPHGQSELRFRTEPAIELYNAVVAKTTGYGESMKPSDVPPHHMSAVAVELIQAIDELDPVIDPNS